MNCFFILSISANLMLIEFVRALAIDNQLNVIRNDCFERLAIGHRLNPKNVYKTFNYNTVAECQSACTQEKEVCKAFSLGIGVKGNSSCELSHDSVKETADLKPIDTLTDTDFDLYIKKLGCQIVLEKPLHQKPSEEVPSGSAIVYSKPVHEDDEHKKPPESYGSQPAYDENSGVHQGYHHQENHEYHGGGNDHQFVGHSKPTEPGYQPSSNSYDKPSLSNVPKPIQSNGYHYSPPVGKPVTHQLHSASESDTVQHVQTLVSIATGPETYLHPVHDILVGQETYSQLRPQRPTQSNGYENPLPFRPQSLNHPYEHDHVRPALKPHQYPPFPDANHGDYDSPSLRPHYYPPRPDKNNGDYDNPNASLRPHQYPPRPDNRDYDNPNPSLRPHQYPLRPDKNNGDYDNPSLRPHQYPLRPDTNNGGYDNPSPPLRPHQYPLRPDNGGYNNPALSHNFARPAQYENSNDATAIELEIDRRYSHQESGYINRFQNRPFRPEPNFLHDRYDRPLPNRYGSVIPHPDDYNKRPENYDYLFEVDPYFYDRKPILKPYENRDRPYRPDQGYNERYRPAYDYYFNAENNNRNNDYFTNKQKPYFDELTTNNVQKNNSESNFNEFTKLTNSYEDLHSNRSIGLIQKNDSTVDNKSNNRYKDFENTSTVKSVISHSIGHNGEKITSIITEIPEGKWILDFL